MFRQVSFADWSSAIAVGAFAVSALVYLFFLVGALRTPRSRIDHDAALPMDEETLS